MAMPEGIWAIDTMIGFPTEDTKSMYHHITRSTKDHQTNEEFEFPAQYMFKRPPMNELKQALKSGDSDAVDITLREMDRWHIERALIGVGGGMAAAAGDPAPGESSGERALRLHPDRFIGSYDPDPNEGVKALQGMVKAYEKWGIRAVSAFPAGTLPQVAINDKKMYPIYAKCVELGIAMFCCAGVPGPRLRFHVQHVELIDEVMYDFPDLVFVTRHGCEPWTDLIVKLMLKWPNLHYSTSAFAPKYYPKAVIDYVNTRGADKFIYGGYFPMGLSLERIWTEMPNVPLREDIWPKFLRENALRVLKLDTGGESPQPATVGAEEVR